MLDLTTMPWAGFNISEARKRYFGRSLGLKPLIRGTNAFGYEIELITREMPLNEARRVKARISGYLDEGYTYTHPRLSYTNGIIQPASVVRANNNYAAGLRNISFNCTEPWQLLAGDIIQFTNHKQVYELSDDTSTQIGVQNIRLNHPLVSSVTQNETVIVNGVTWELECDGILEIETEASNDQEVELAVKLVEK